MFKAILQIFDKPPQDALTEEIEKESVVSQYWVFIGAALLSILVTMTSLAIFWVKFKVPPTPIVFVKSPDGVTKQVISLPYPHQSFKNIQNWVEDAVMAVYSLDFVNYNVQVSNAKNYFTKDGYSAYKNALSYSGLEKSLKEQRFKIAAMTRKTPIMIDRGGFGDSFFWKLNVPIMVNYIGSSKEVITKEYNVDVVVVRSPSHLNHKGLAISQFVINQN